MRALVRVRSVDGKRSLVITIPKPIRDHTAIFAGDYVMITVKGMFKFEVEKDPVRKENKK